MGEPAVSAFDGIDYSDLGFPQATAADLARNPYDEDGYCEFCGNGHWKHHAPWCTWQDLVDSAASGDQP